MKIEIARLADIILVVLVPGMGDDVQSLKAGVMEIADIFVINKSDREGADRVEQEIRAMQSLAQAHPPGRRPSSAPSPPPATGSACSPISIAKYTMAVRRKPPRARRAGQWQRRLDAMLRTELMRRARRHGLIEATAAESTPHTSPTGQKTPGSSSPNSPRSLFAGNPSTSDRQRCIRSER